MNEPTNECHGDELEIECEQICSAELYEAEHADDYKYTDEWLSDI